MSFDQLRNQSHSQTHRSIVRSGTRLKALVLSGAILTLGTLGGCNNAGEGLFTGAALGAVTGLAIGSLDGNAGEGAVLGTIIGGAGGAILGDQNERNRQNAQYGGSGYRTNTRTVYQTEYRYYPAPRPHGRPHHRPHHDRHGEWWHD